MVNYARGFNQSETRKYFEWIKTSDKPGQSSIAEFEYISVGDFIMDEILSMRAKSEIVRCFIV